MPKTAIMANRCCSEFRVATVRPFLFADGVFIMASPLSFEQLDPGRFCCFESVKFYLKIFK